MREFLLAIALGLLTVALNVLFLGSLVTKPGFISVLLGLAFVPVLSACIKRSRFVAGLSLLASYALLSFFSVQEMFVPKEPVWPGFALLFTVFALLSFLAGFSFVFSPLVLKVFPWLRK